MDRLVSLLLALGFLLRSQLLASAHHTKIHLHNSCPFPIWPAWIPNAGVPQIPPGGAKLDPSKSIHLLAPWGWSGRFWGRTGCYFDTAATAATNPKPCETGDCNAELGCLSPGIPPATLVEFTPLRDPHTSLDHYDVSLVDGYNLPIRVIPSDPSCKSAGCDARVGDLLSQCPPELAVRRRHSGAAIACKSPCLAFQLNRFCCTGDYGTPDRCRPTSYSQCFKRSCPDAYSYPFDSITSGFSCGSGGEFTIVFCPRDGSRASKSVF